jgi:hypothetical protein
MEWFLLLFRVLGWIVAGSAVVELLAALFSTRVRGYMALHPVAHVVWFACALCLTLILIPAYCARRGGL